MVRLFAFLQVVIYSYKCTLVLKVPFAATPLCNNLKFKGECLCFAVSLKRTSLAHNFQMGTNELDEIKKLFEF